jgi:hypothetical protein
MFALFFLLCNLVRAQNVVVCDWEIIDFPLEDAKKISEMLRVELLTKHPVISRDQMHQELDAAHIVVPSHLEKSDIQRLAELFQAKFLVTGLITRMENQFILNVRLLEMPAVDTLISVSKNISGALLEPSQTIIPEIAQKLEPYLPVVERKHNPHFKFAKILGISSIIGGGIVGYLMWPNDKKSNTEEAKLPRPPKFPY